MKAHDKIELYTSVALLVIFGLLGLGALIGALFFGATHQYAMVVVCAISANGNLRAIKKLKSRSYEKSN